MSGTSSAASSHGDGSGSHAEVQGEAYVSQPSHSLQVSPSSADEDLSFRTNGTNTGISFDESHNGDATACVGSENTLNGHVHTAVEASQNNSDEGETKNVQPMNGSTMSLNTSSQSLNQSKYEGLIPSPVASSDVPSTAQNQQVTDLGSLDQPSYSEAVQQEPVISPDVSQQQQYVQTLSPTSIQRQNSNGSNTNTNPPVNTIPTEVIPQPIQQQQQAPTPAQELTNNEMSEVDMKIDIDSILTSPKAKDDIVEKSPGGRYLRFSEKLGSGAYKEVYRAYDTSEGIEVAWNVVNLSGVPKAERQYIVNEVRLLEKLNHSNIISFHGSWVNRGLEQVIFVTEILSSGTLKQFINKVKVIRYKIAKRWAIQILKGLEYLHGHNPPIVHRDLKCDNIFINGTSGDLRIGDLGLSTVIVKRSKVLSVLGTPEFMAPELYDEQYDEKVDIYAFGMCMLEIFTKEIPYRECTNPAQIYKRVSSGIEPESLERIRSNSAKDFIRQCLGRKDENGVVVRPSAKELLSHPFLAKREDDVNEIQVDPPLRERAISEAPSQNAGSDEKSRRKNSGSDSGNSAVLVMNGQQTPFIQENRERINSVAQPQTVKSETPPISKETNIPQKQESRSFDFDSMPDSETNMKPVKVLMGRGQEVDNANGKDHLPIPIQTQEQAPPVVSSPLPSPPPSGQNPVQVPAQIITKKIPDSMERRQSANSLNSQGGPIYSNMNYLRMATVIEDNNAFMIDIMEIRITLLVGSEEQHVQFQFHLVQDDAVQVAKEMVAELNLPNDAILEVSETISALARVERVKQENIKTAFMHQQQQQQQQQIAHSVSQQLSNQYVPQNLQQQPPTQINSSSLDQSIDLGAEPVPWHIATNDASLCPPSNGSGVYRTSNGSGVYQSQRSATPLVHNNSQPVTFMDTPTQVQQNVQQQGQYPPRATKSASGITSSTQGSGSIQTILNSVASGTSLPQHQNLPDVSIDLPQELEGNEDIKQSAELKQLMEELEKKKQRAQKAFHTRMENLVRSKEEKEAQHLKTLEKHEKERAALEKRLQKAEEEQQLRLQKMEREFYEKVAEESKKLSNDNVLDDNAALEEIFTQANIASMSDANDDSFAPQNTRKTPSPLNIENSDNGFGEII